MRLDVTGVGFLEKFGCVYMVYVTCDAPLENATRFKK